jgi:hypothetical protein
LRGRETEDIMFEVPEDKEERKREHLWLGVTVVVLVVLGGALLYYMSQHSAKGTGGRAASSVAPKTAPDPVHDLKILRATMDKDRTGTTAVWLVSVENRSSGYTYSNIRYETTYVDANNAPLLVNQGALPFTLGPGQVQNSEIRDALYPTGTAFFKFRITDAKSAVE